MGGRGQAASNAGRSGRHERTDSTPRTPCIGPAIEAWAGGHEAQIMRTKSTREEAFLDTLGVRVAVFLREPVGEKVAFADDNG